MGHTKGHRMNRLLLLLDVLGRLNDVFQLAETVAGLLQHFGIPPSL